jgi:hypothetical protein
MKEMRHAYKIFIGKSQEISWEIWAQMGGKYEGVKK